MSRELAWLERAIRIQPARATCAPEPDGWATPVTVIPVTVTPVTATPVTATPVTVTGAQPDGWARTMPRGGAVRADGAGGGRGAGRTLRGGGSVWCAPGRRPGREPGPTRIRTGAGGGPGRRRCRLVAVLVARVTASYTVTLRRRRWRTGAGGHQGVPRPESCAGGGAARAGVCALLDWHELPGRAAPRSCWSGERGVGRSRLGRVEGDGDYGEPGQAGR